MRGKVPAVGGSAALVRITPAYAEKRLWCRGHGAPGQDYPRICGEKMDNAVCDFYFFGSPPHMRGKVGAVVQLRAGAGITPAYAGKRTPYTPMSFTQRDHPRVCGEKSVHPLASHVRMGSPPRMRGKDALLSPMLAPARITPAYAGKRHPCTGLQVIGRDHPRVCGEKFVRA